MSVWVTSLMLSLGSVGGTWLIARGIRAGWAVHAAVPSTGQRLRRGDPPVRVPVDFRGPHFVGHADAPSLLGRVYGKDGLRAPEYA